MGGGAAVRLRRRERSRTKGFVASLLEEGHHTDAAAGINSDRANVRPRAAAVGPRAAAVGPAGVPAPGEAAEKFRHHQ